MSRALYATRRVLWMPLTVQWAPPTAEVRPCCEPMRHALDFACEEHADPFACADGIIVYSEVFDEYGLPVHDGGTSYVLIDNCPWCGGRLPESQRERWFDETERLLGPDCAENALPERYLTGGWRRSGGHR